MRIMSELVGEAERRVGQYRKPSGTIVSYFAFHGSLIL
jgi:hypothetical protein